MKNQLEVTESLEERYLKSKSLKMVFVVTPNYGHFFPMSRIAVAASEKGHECHIVSVDNERGRTGLQKHLDGTAVQLHLTPGMEMDIIMTDIGDDRIDPKDKFINAWAQGCMDKIKELKPDVVIGDMLAAPAFVVADQIKVPSLINNPAGSYSLY